MKALSTTVHHHYDLVEKWHVAETLYNDDDELCEPGRRLGEVDCPVVDRMLSVPLTRG